MSNWKIRAAHCEDAEGLERCMHAAYSIYQERMGTLTLPPLQADYRVEIAEFPAWVAEANDKIVGGLIMNYADDYATLVNVAVHPHYQGHGLGRGLMEFAETQAKKEGYSCIRLATHALLKENLSMYNHLGWTQSGSEGSRVYFRKAL